MPKELAVALAGKRRFGGEVPSTNRSGAEPPVTVNRSGDAHQPLEWIQWAVVTSLGG
jgi:hypothetical protein